MKKEIENWWKQAEIELKAAESNLSEYPFLTATLSQQAVEKGLKALYILKLHESPPKTHDLTLLCDKLKTPAKIRKIGEELTPPYMFSRYPNVTQTIPAFFYSKENAKQFLELAKEAMVWIKKELNL